MITCIDIFTWFILSLINRLCVIIFHIAILLHAVLLYCLYEQSSAHISFWPILFLQFCLGRLKHKHIICSQIKFYATIEPCIYIEILPIARGEVGGLVPRLMF